MMALERPPIDNTLGRSDRPETSNKFSRSSRRTEFQSTLTDMGSNLDFYNKAHHPPNKKGDTQTKFYSTKNKFSKTNSFSSTFYPSDKNPPQKNLDGQRDTAAGSDRFPGTHESEILDNSPSPMNFRLSNGDFKQGTTLDKVLGGQFKKIDIFDANIKEFEKTSSLNDHGIDEKTDEESAVDEKDYQYESFEILETDDEEDTVSEIHQEKDKDGIRSSQHRDVGGVQENHEVLSRIQNKYKSSKPKFLPKTKPKGLRSRSPLKEKVEEINTEHGSTDRSEAEYRRERGSSTRTESKSSSPKFGANYSTKFPSFVGFAFDGHHHHQQTYNTDNTPVSSGDALAFKELVKNSSSPGHFTQTQTSFRGTQTNFQATNENFRTTNEKFRSSFMKKTFYNNGKALTQVNPTTLTGFPERDSDYDRERTGTRSSSLASSMKYPENAAAVAGKFQPEKLTGAALEQKFLRENKMMTQKIMQGEKELMEKYAKMFKLNKKEINFGKEEKRYEGSKRLSTPMKDFNQSRNFQKRKIINL